MSFHTLGLEWLLIVALNLSAINLYQKNSEQTVKKPFLSKFQQSISASWTNRNLRTILKQISQDRQVSIILDRRIDPSRLFQVDLKQQTLRSGLEKISSLGGAQLSLLENFAYIGPEHAANQLKTLIKLRTEELFERQLSVSKQRRKKLLIKKLIIWDDLARPVNLLHQISQQAQLPLQNLENIPHDLWAQAKLPQTNAVEALSLILIQFDLTFQWKKRAAGIEIIPIPKRVVIAQKYRPTADQTIQEILKICQTAFPKLETKTISGKVVVYGSVEQHEQIKKLLSPDQTQTQQQPNTVVPLQRRIFSLRIEQVPVSAVLKKLADSGIQFEYDLQQLNKAGIDLNQRISLQVEKVKADKFFRELFSPLKLQFKLQKQTVILKPAP